MSDSPPASGPDTGATGSPESGDPDPTRPTRGERRRAEEEATYGAWRRWRARQKAKPRATGFKAWLKELPILLAIAFVLALLIKTFVVQAFFVPSGSMEQTLHGCPGCAGDRILVNEMSYWFSDPQPGDIVVFKGEDDWAPEFTVEKPSNVFGEAWLWLKRAVGAAPPDEKDFVKRVIAGPGQTIMCCDAQQRVVVDGKPLDEPYIYVSSDAVGGNADPSTYQQEPFGPITVPAGRLFVMGDHRNNSADSRYHISNQYQGTIAIDSVIGRAFVRVWPFDRFGWLHQLDIQAGGALGFVGAPPVAGAALLTALSARRIRRARQRVTHRVLRRGRVP